MVSLGLIKISRKVISGFSAMAIMRNCGLLQVGAQDFEAKLQLQEFPNAVLIELDSASFRSHWSRATSKFGRTAMCIYGVQTSQMAWYNFLSNALLASSLQPLNRTTVIIKPYLHLQYKAAQDTSPPSDRCPTLP